METDSHECWDASLIDCLDEIRIEIDPENIGSTFDVIKKRLLRYGFAMLEGLGADEGREVIAERLVTLSQRLGRLVPQSSRRERIEDIKDYSDIDDNDERGYRSRGEFSPHSDPPTLILLHCLRPARRGGENHVVNVGSIYRKMCEIDEARTQRLFQPFPSWDPEGSTDRRQGGTATPRRPVLTRQGDVISCVLYRPYIEMAAKELAEPLSADDVAAFDLFDSCANDSGLSLRFHLERGQTLLLHNRTVLHARTDYEDWPEIERRRHLLRAWIDAPELLPVSPEHELGDIFGGIFKFID